MDRYRSTAYDATMPDIDNPPRALDRTAWGAPLQLYRGLDRLDALASRSNGLTNEAEIDRIGTGAMLFVAGDDDQSIYSFRHANPMGIVHFLATYPAATTHTLSACFRCTPAILGPASNLIAHNPNRGQASWRS
jgi:superfamily I DNA/RNA helicase